MAHLIEDLTPVSPDGPRSSATSTAGVWVTNTVTNSGFWCPDRADAEREIALLEDPSAVAKAREVEDRLVTEEYCQICHRATDHRAEHSMQQLLAAARMRGRRSVVQRES